jgi:beta-glucosidase/6-phospho-beta-glucosidase/beta-galactosidase
MTSSSVTENGFPAKGETDKPVEEAIHDEDRVRYYSGYTQAMLEAINLDGVNVKSYFAWSAFSALHLCSNMSLILSPQVYLTTLSGQMDIALGSA